MADAVLLVSVQALKDRMLINPDLLGVDPPLESAIRGAQLRVAAFFDSQLQAGSYEEVFFLDSDAFSGIQPAGLFRLMLGNAFVKAGTVSITMGGKWNETTEPAPVGFSKIDPIRGIGYLDAELFRDKYVTVKYDAGFATDGETLDWIKEALLAYAPQVFNMGQVTNRNAEAEPGYKLSGDHALAILAPYTRNKGMCFRPVS